MHVPRLRLPAVLALLAVSTAPAMAQGTWTQWSGNGHYYQVVTRASRYTWEEAKQDAKSRGGYLATIHSATENDFVFNLASDPVYWDVVTQFPARLFGPWIGGMQPFGSAEPFAGWGWVTGEPWTFTAWETGEPNNSTSGGLPENFLHYYALGSVPDRTWNDYPSAPHITIKSYVMEADSLPIGRPYCGIAIANSSGGSAWIQAYGSDLVTANNVEVVACGLPTNSTGYFIGSLTGGFVPNAGGSTGTLCVGGTVGRYDLPGQVMNSGVEARIALALDLTLTPSPTGPIELTAGDTWHLQAWFRDTDPTGQPTSNFTNAVRVTFH